MNSYTPLRNIIHFLSFLLLSLSFCSIELYGQTRLTISNLRCEHKINPIGIQNQQPHLSWQIQSNKRNQTQSAYRILVADSQEKLNTNNGNIWDSKKVKANESISVVYTGKTLESAKHYYWKVQIWNQQGVASKWSIIASWQMGLLSSTDWKDAAWICYENLEDSLKVVPGIHGSGDELGNKGIKQPVVPLFRKAFTIRKGIRNATLFISGLGHYEASINGKNITENFLAPGWTKYDKTTLYNSYDVTRHLTTGDNALGVIVGNGFYNINRERYRKLVIAYGMPKMICKLHIEYYDGTTQTIVSGKDWKCSPSPITFTSIYGGEDYDAQLEQTGWNRPGFNDKNWKRVLLAEIPKGELTAETDYPLTVRKILNVKKLETLAPNRYLYDFGQNASGIIALKVKGKKGQVVKLTPGELITKNKEINQKASGSPYYLSYTLKGDGEEIWKPRFTYYGFRYVMVEGATPASEKASGDLPIITGLTSLHTSNSAPSTGAFTCSNQLFNQIYTLIDWAIRSNMQSVITDCPHREKLGWLEQDYLMGASMHYNYDLYPLYKQIIKDMMDSQTSNGLIPDIAPEYVEFGGGFRDSPEWGSSGVILPWMLYQWYGDKEILKTAWPMMTRYVDYLNNMSKDNILSHGLGDWYDLGPKFPGVAQLTPKAVTATAIYYYDIKLLAQMAIVLSDKEAALKWTALAEKVKASFNQKFFNEQTKVYSTGSQTAMSMPLCVGLVDDNNRKMVFQNMTDSIIKSGKRLTAGDVGFHFLVQALEEGGGSQLLYDMNFRNDVPGYGFQLKKGATALTESWAALEEVSNNHLMLGHMMEWFYTGLGGIKQQENTVAFKDLIIRPEIVGDLTESKTSYQSLYGTIKSEWKRDEKSLLLHVEVPFNTSATVYLPTTNRASITEGNKPIDQLKDIQYVGTENNKAKYKIGSGNYSFKLIMN
ncbi:MAG: family 78 glycoside hydrolase catalytic domain [Bacteroidetes bacterium]|nr:family 78 glycoside hydrolase catalytic domain [Bacteroidota bacterium]